MSHSKENLPCCYDRVCIEHSCLDDRIVMFLEANQEFFDKNPWRGEDETMSLMPIGNYEAWAIEKLKELFD